MISILCCIVWILVLSLLLFFSWNHVVCHVTKLKKVVYWQALLIVLLFAAVKVPHYMKRYYGMHGGGMCSTHSKLMSGYKSCPLKGTPDCPYEKAWKSGASGSEKMPAHHPHDHSGTEK